MTSNVTSAVKCEEDLFCGVNVIKDPENIDRIMYWRADKKFHTMMLSFCHNDLVKKLNDNLQILNRVFRGGVLREPDETLPEHMTIVNALKVRDAEAARSVVAESMNKSRKLYQDIVNNLKQIGIDTRKLYVDDLSGNLYR